MKYMFTRNIAPVKWVEIRILDLHYRWMHIMAMTLGKYLAANGLSQRLFGIRVGVDQGTVSRILAQVYLPSGTLVRKIYAATGGAVTPNDLLLAPPESEEAAE